MKVLQDMELQHYEDEASEFDYYLQWQWPDYIEKSLRRMMWFSLVEACEPGFNGHQHTVLLRRQMAKYPESPAPVLDYLAKFDDPKLLIRIAENPNTGTATLARLAQHDQPQVRLAVAGCDRLPVAVMEMLVADECPDVRYAMAENFALPSTLLRTLSSSENPYVAARAARTLARRQVKKPRQFPLHHQQGRKAQ